MSDTVCLVCAVSKVNKMKKNFNIKTAVLLIIILFCFDTIKAKSIKSRLEKPSLGFSDSRIDTIHSISQQISNFKDQRVAAISLAQLADNVWSKDADYARSLFTISISKLSVDKKNEEREIARRKNAFLEVTALIAKNDPIWAKDLINGFAEEFGGSANVNLEIADRLLKDDSKRAAEFAAQSLQNEYTENFVRFLKNLRQQNEAEANQLFLQVISVFPHQRRVDANQFAMLGTYLFSSPFINSQDFQSVSLTRIGNIMFPNIAVSLPNISPNLVREYIRNAVIVIHRPSNEQNQRESKYALGYLLIPKAQEFAPDLVGAIGGAMASLTPEISLEMTNEDAFKYHNKTNSVTPSERIEEIEKIADSHTRDQLFLDIVFQSWRQNDFQTARIAAAKIENTSIKNELETLILFGEARVLIKNGEIHLGQATQIAEKLPVSSEKCLLWLGIAAEKQSRKLQATAELNSAQMTASRLNDQNTPFLLLFISGQMSEDDNFQSNTVLNEAINSFNRFENLTQSSLMRKISLEPLNLRFNLSVSGVNLDFQKNFEKVIVGREEEGLQIIESLKNESLKGQAFVILAKSLLSKVKNKPMKVDEIVVRVGEDGIRKSAVKKIMPAYPKESLQKKSKGVAVAEIQYDGNGDVSEVKILESPDSATGESVAKAMQQWKFKPSRMNDKAISIRGKVTFYFVIDAKGVGRVENPKQFQ